jgi:hypothetical protein
MEFLPVSVGYFKLSPLKNLTLRERKMAARSLIPQPEMPWMIEVMAQVDARDHAGVQLVLVLLIEHEGIAAKCSQLLEVQNLPIPTVWGG